MVMWVLKHFFAAKDANSAKKALMFIVILNSSEGS